MSLHARAFLAGIVGLAVVTAASAEPPRRHRLRVSPASVLQQLIDRAEPGSTVRVPAGVYKGSVRLNKEIRLVGAGARRTILDGEGAEHALLVEGSALVAQITVRGGQTGIEFRGEAATLQDSIVTRNRVRGVHCLSSTVLFNNRIYGNGWGVMVNSRAPVLLHNTIAANRDGNIWSWYAPGPTLIHNLVTHGRVALEHGAGSAPELIDNVEWGHAAPSKGFLVEEPIYASADPLDGQLALAPETLLSQAVELSPLLRLRDEAESAALYPVGYLGARRAEVELDRSRIRAFVRRFEPRLTYRLSAEPGVFQVELAFSQVPFQLGLSGTDTRVEVLRAWDTEGKIPVHADLRKGERASVEIASLDPDAPRQSQRYRLLCEFVDPKAWRPVRGGRMLFERLTSFEPSQIVPPKGWTLRRLPSRRTDQGLLIRAVLTPPARTPR